jgi:hypothetical protein
MLTAPASFQFNTPPNMNLGTIRPRGKKEGQVTLDANGVPHDMDVQLSTDLTKRGLSVEIQTPNGWQKLGSSPVRQRLTAGSRMGWPIRVSAASCPAACSATEPHQITVEASLAGGGSASARIPVTVEVLPDPWLQCNWPLLAAGALLMVLSAVAYGFYWPYRFPNRLGVQLSPEVDLSEGFFYHLKKQHGAGSGFYRHARVFVAADFRISGKSNNAFARLRANRKDAMIQPAGGQGLWRQRIDGEWERLPDQETTARTGVMYRNDDGSVFFDLRLK